MSKSETPITRWYWKELGGLLIEEFCLVDRAPKCGPRWADALILPERESGSGKRGEKIDIASGDRAVIVQTKRSRLGMYLMGQTLFSAELLRRRFPSARIESVALCTQDDEVLRSLLEAHEGCSVVVVPPGDLLPAWQPSAGR